MIHWPENSNSEYYMEGEWEYYMEGEWEYYMEGEWEYVGGTIGNHHESCLARIEAR